MMQSPDKIVAGSLSISVVAGSSGPRLRCKGWLEPLGWLANAWIDSGDLDSLIGAVARGERAARSHTVVYPPTEAFAEERARWQQETGTEAGDDVMVIKIEFIFDALVMPRPLLLQILEELARRRANPTAVTTSTPAVGAPPPQPATIDGQLFAATATATAPAAYEEASMRELEERASQLDRDAETARGEMIARVAVRRQNLLGDLAAAGLLDVAQASEKRRWLDAWGLPTLRGYLDAATALDAYYRSAERQRFNLAPPPAALVDGAISFDWFRRPSPPPPDATPDSWLGFLEEVLKSNSPTAPASGEILSHVRDRWYRLRWRRDDGVTPKVLSAAVISSG